MALAHEQSWLADSDRGQRFQEVRKLRGAMGAKASRRCVAAVPDNKHTIVRSQRLATEKHACAHKGGLSG
eukprot:9033471-Alexandrium_andersonii.AAC.1